MVFKRVVLSIKQVPGGVRSMVGVKKSSHLPSVQWYGQYRAVSVRSRLISKWLPFLSVFKLFLFCPKGSPSVLVSDPDSEIKRAWSLIAQEGSQQFGDHDRARAT